MLTEEPRLYFLHFWGVNEPGKVAAGLKSTLDLLGVTMATQGGWFGSPWLTMKLAFVVALSGLHGMLSGTLRRLARADRPSAMSSYAQHAIIVAIIVIVLLVVVKPF